MIDVEEQIKIVRDHFFNELWNEKNLSAAENTFTDDFITETIGLEPSNWALTHGTGPRSMKHHIEWWLQIIPNAKMKVIDTAATGNKVITNWELQGRTQGEIFGFSRTNQEVHIFGCTVSIFRGNKICLNKTMFDRLGLFQQIRILPSTEVILQQKMSSD